MTVAAADAPQTLPLYKIVAYRGIAPRSLCAKLFVRVGCVCVNWCWGVLCKTVVTFFLPAFAAWQ